MHSLHQLSAFGSSSGFVVANMLVLAYVVLEVLVQMRYAS